MKPIVLNVRFAVKERILKGLRRCRGAGDKARYLVIVNLLNGRSVAEVVEILRMHNTTAYRVSKRFQAYGEAGLHDGRADNGADKLDEDYSSKWDRVVRGTPTQSTFISIPRWVWIGWAAGSKRTSTPQVRTRSAMWPAPGTCAATG